VLASAYFLLMVSYLRLGGQDIKPTKLKPIKSRKDGIVWVVDDRSDNRTSDNRWVSGEESGCYCPNSGERADVQNQTFSRPNARTRYIACISFRS
jgi:hypothetical protein